MLDLAAPVFVVKTLQPRWFYGSWISPQRCSNYDAAKGWLEMSLFSCDLNPMRPHCANIKMSSHPKGLLSDAALLLWRYCTSTLPPWDPEIGFDSTWIRWKAIISTSTFWRNMSCKWATCATCPAWRTLMLFWKDGGWDFRKKKTTPRLGIQTPGQFSVCECFQTRWPRTSGYSTPKACVYTVCRRWPCYGPRPELTNL